MRGGLVDVNRTLSTFAMSDMRENHIQSSMSLRICWPWCICWVCRRRTSACRLAMVASLSSAPRGGWAKENEAARTRARVGRAERRFMKFPLKSWPWERDVSEAAGSLRLRVSVGLLTFRGVEPALELAVALPSRDRVVGRE